MNLFSINLVKYFIQLIPPYFRKKKEVLLMMDLHRISVTLPEDLREQIKELKKDKFYDVTYSELYRQAIAAGIEVIKKEEKILK